MLALTTRFIKLQGNQSYVLATVQIEGFNRNQTRTNTETEGSEPNIIYVETRSNL